MPGPKFRYADALSTSGKCFLGGGSLKFSIALMIHTLVLFAVVAVDQIVHKHNGSVPDDERTTNGATSALRLLQLHL